jgi:polar amino acid transport system substrate-binding protein
MTRRAAHPLLAALLALSALATACAPADEDDTAGTTSSPTDSASAEPDPCVKESLQTKTEGTLTIGTDKPAYEPWFVEDDPTNGKGFESAVAYAVAEELGYSTTEVTWVTVRFDAAIQPGPKDFDFDINQFSITPERQQVVDFSSPYYDVTQTVITTADSKAANAASIADLKGVKLGAQVGTTSLAAINEVIEPSAEAAVFNSNDDAKVALENGQIDALVVDLPTAFFITAAELENGKIVGQLPPSAGDQEQFGLLLDKDSPLTDCVSQAVDTLRDNGTLDELEQEWLAQAAGAPVLQ